MRAVDLLGHRRARQAREVVAVRVRVVGELVPRARQLGEQRPPLGVLLQVRADDEERGAQVVPREQLGEARQAAPQDGEPPGPVGGSPSAWIR